MRPQTVKLGMRNAAASSSKKKMHMQALALRFPCKLEACCLLFYDR